MAHKETDLTRAELALIASRLQMPLIARDYLNAAIEPEDDTQYALHGLMSDLSPAQALVCAILTLQEIAASHEGLTYLQDFCGNILKYYGTNVLNNPDNTCDLSLNLGHTLDDLEHTLELAQMCKMSFELVRPETIVFLDILIPQLESQIMIVEEVMRLKSMQQKHTPFNAEPLNA